MPTVSGYTGSPTVTTGVKYRGLTGTLYEWNAAGSGSLTFSTGGAIYALLVGGGGAGGADSYGETGGGGGGGGVLEQEITATATSYSLTIGAGGVAGIPGTSDPTAAGDTTGFSLTAVGGGHGAGDGEYNRYDATGGGSGGGGGAGLNQTAGAGTSGQGYAGADGTSDHRNGGGGGAGGPGIAGHANERGGAGGRGILSGITGEYRYYGGGGGGSHLLNRTEPRNIGGQGGGGDGFRGTTTYATSGADGFGGGGGGSVYYATSSSRVAGDGGDGTIKVFVPDGGAASDWTIVDKRSDSAPDGGNVAFDLTAMEWTAGDLAVVKSAVGTTTVSTTPGISESGWTTRADVFANDTRDAVLGVFTRKLVGGDTTVTVLGTGSTNQSLVADIEIHRGLDADDPLNVAVVPTDGGNTAVPAFGSITPSTAGTPILAVAAAPSAAGRSTRFGQSGLTHFASFGEDDSADVVMGSGWHEWTSGAYTPGTWTLEGDIDSASNSYATALIAFNLAPAGPTDTVAKCTAAAKVGSTVGKANFRVNPSPAYTEGQRVRFQTCMVFSSETDVDFSGLKIIDFENNTISGNPGFRVQVYNNGGSWGITLNLDKLNGPVTTTYGIETSGVTFPGLSLDTPYLIDVEVLLGGDPGMVAGDTTTGHVRIWLDDGTTRTLVYNKSHRTMITQAYWTAEGLPGSITVNLSSIQVGATANSDETYAAVVYLGSTAIRVDDGAWDVFSDWESTPPETGWDGTTISSGSALAADDAPVTMIEPDEATIDGYIDAWSGSAWAKQPVKHWNGSAWREAHVKHWNGSAWAEV